MRVCNAEGSLTKMCACVCNAEGLLTKMCACVENTEGLLTKICACVCNAEGLLTKYINTEGSITKMQQTLTREALSRVIWKAAVSPR